MYHVTTRKSHALAVILNNDTFQGDLDDRPGSKHDVLQLEKVLDQNLGFKVMKYRNLTSQEIKQLFETKIDGEIKAHHDSFFCCIMSHGGKAGICGTDGTPVSTTELKGFLSGKSELLQKPKIMIFQCCRGPGKPQPVYPAKGPGSAKPNGKPQPDFAAEDQGSPKPTSPRSDFICGYSTVDGDIATLGEDGSPYIQTLCEVMKKNDCGLVDMLHTVNRKLTDRGVQEVKVKDQTYNLVQTGEIEDTLQGDIFFHPPE